MVQGEDGAISVTEFHGAGTDGDRAERLQDVYRDSNRYGSGSTAHEGLQAVP